MTGFKFAVQQLGVATVYALGVTGKNNNIIKGALTGQATWTTLYGVLGTLGATKVSAVSPSTVLSELVGHTAYGMVAALLAVKLGDPGLYDGTIPMSAQQKNKSQKGQQQNQQESTKLSKTANGGNIKLVPRYTRHK